MVQAGAALRQEASESAVVLAGISRRIPGRANGVSGVEGLNDFQFAVAGRYEDVVNGGYELGRPGVDHGLGLALGLVDEMLG